MPIPQVVSPKPNHIRAVFRTSAAFFDMSRAATFEELAERLCRLGERHDGPLTSIEIEPEPANDRQYSLQALLRELAAL